jgi:hypothetical protein
MFRPISFNVIRQALDWHGFPVPKLRQLSLDDHDLDCVTAEYVATWTRQQVEQVAELPEFWATNVARWKFEDTLKQCFCEDVRITNVSTNEEGATLTALLYVKVDRCLLYWASFLTENYA